MAIYNRNNKISANSRMGVYRGKGNILRNNNRFASLLPTVYIDRVTLESAGSPALKATVQFCIKQKNNKNTIIEWLNNPEIKKSLKFKLVQSTDLAATKKLTENINIIDNNSIKNNIQIISNITIDSVIGGADNFIENNSSTDSSGNVIMSIYFNQTFELDNPNPDHLAYFVLPYLGVDDFKTHNGHTSVEIIIKNNKSTNPLTQDFREINKIKQSPISSTYIENKLLTEQNKIFSLKNDNMIPTRKEAYFSEILLSRNKTGEAKFAFALDYNKLLRSSSDLKYLHENVINNREETLANYVSMQAMILKRRRVKTNNTRNKLGTLVQEGTLFDRDTIVETLLIASGVRNNIINAKNDNAGLREVKASLRKKEGTRFYIGHDNTTANLQGGIYQYGIEVTIEDKTAEYLMSLVNDLTKARKKLYEYYIQATKPGATNYDPHIDTSAREASEEGNSSGNYNLNADRFTQKFIKEQIGKTNNWEEPVNNYFNILKIVTANKSISKKSILNMTNPETANPKSIMAIIKSMDDIITKLSSITGLNDATKNETVQTGKIKTATSKKAYKIIKVEYWFANNEFHADIGNNTGYEYLSTKPSKAFRDIGFESITIEDYLNRVDTEEDTISSLSPVYCYIGGKVFDINKLSDTEDYAKLEAAILAHNSSDGLINSPTLSSKDIKHSMVELYSSLSLVVKSKDEKDIIKPIEPVGVKYLDSNIDPNELFLSLSKVFSKSGATNASSADNPFIGDSYNEDTFIQLMANGVDILSGFENKRPDTRIKSLLWEPLTESKWRTAKRGDDVLICRINQPEELKGLKLPIFNNYFMILINDKGGI